MDANLNFDSFYQLAKLVFDPISNLFNTIKVNGTSLIVILVTVTLVILILRFVIGAPTFGLGGIGHEKAYKSRKSESSHRTDYYKEGAQYYRNRNTKSGRGKR